jgi:sugar phosphate isomerase/epimerase
VQYFKSSLAKILDYNAGRLTICIENTHDLPPSFLEAMTLLAEDQGLRFAWDIGYTDILAQDSRARMLKFYSDNSSFVKIFHLHDINESGGHKALGTGRINVSAYMEIINTIKADVILEIFPEKSLLDSINYINGLAPKLKTMP